MSRRCAEIPNPNISAIGRIRCGEQPPENIQITSSKSVLPIVTSWILNLEVSLDVGGWNLEFLGKWIY